MNYTLINECPITGKTNKTKYLDLGDTPLVNNLCDTRDEAINATKYPLSLNYFHSSGETALSHAINGELLFSNYVFKSGVNIPYIEHCKNMFDYIENIKPITNGDVIVDIGGNDGTLLKTFKEKQENSFKNEEFVQYVNIDASKNLTELAEKNGITSINDFFTDELVSDLFFQSDLIISTNVFQHLKDLNSFVKGIKNFLRNEGLWVLEFPYWINSMETNQFDQVYHEHMYYHSITPLNQLFENHGLKIIDISFHEMHGGSLRMIMTHKDETKFEVLPSVKEFTKKEEKYDFEYHKRWGKSIDSFICKTIYELNELITDNKTIFGFGAAAKGCIFLNSMNYDYKDIPYVIDDTDLKQGKFIPGTGIEIVSRDILKTESPDYILILAHNFKDYIMDSLRDFGYKGKFITLIPEFKIYE